MNEYDEHEWQMQESARRRARGAVSRDAADRRNAAENVSDESYDAVARGLRMDSRDATPLDFAKSAAHAILLRAASDRRTRRRFERRVLGALALAYVLALAGAALVLAQDFVPLPYRPYQQNTMWLLIAAVLSATGGVYRRRR